MLCGLQAAQHAARGRGRRRWRRSGSACPACANSSSASTAICGPEVGAADADVDDVGDARASARTVLGVGQHGVERGVHLGAARRRSRADGASAGARSSGVQHRAAFGVVDRLAGEHRVAVRLAGRTRAPGRAAAPAVRGVDAGSSTGRRRRSGACWLKRVEAARRRAAKASRRSKLAAVGVEVRLQRGPGRGAGRSGRQAHSGGLDQLVELDRVGGEGADAFGQLLGGHRVLVEREAEAGLVVAARACSVSALARRRRRARARSGASLGLQLAPAARG